MSLLKIRPWRFDRSHTADEYIYVQEIEEGVELYIALLNKNSLSMKLWQKGAAAHQKVDHFTVGKDREYDLQLAAYDCEASMAHAQMLAKIGLLSTEEAAALVES